MYLVSFLPSQSMTQGGFIVGYYVAIEILAQLMYIFTQPLCNEQDVI